MYPRHALRFTALSSFLFANGCATAQQAEPTAPQSPVVIHAPPAIVKTLPTPPRNVRIGGQDFFPLDEVARYCGMSYEQRGSTATLRTGERSLRFSTTDEREAKINGLTVWLNDRITDWQGRLMLSRADFAKTIYPILWPRANMNNTVRVIVLDPGHGGSDTGARGNRLTEKILTLDIAKRVKAKLDESDSGLTVLLTRNSDSFPSLEARAAFARSKNADLFVSIHFNALPPRSGQARGIETYALPPAGEASTAGGRDVSAQLGNRFDAENIFLAYMLHSQSIAATDMPDRGVKRSRFVVLNEAPCPATLIECGFVTNRTDAARIATTDYKNQLADSIARAILAYKQAFDPLKADSIPNAQR